MGLYKGCGAAFRSRNGGWVVCLLFLAMAGVGCQSGAPTVSNRILISHLPGVDFSGLKSMQMIDSVKIDCSLPSQWIAAPLDDEGIYTHQQWKSPTRASGAGVVYAHLPFPVSAKTLLWFAKLEYSKSAKSGGHALGEWTDSLGRPWFEAENTKYHVKGYAIVDGFNAWIVYYGYKVKQTPNPSELAVGGRFAETVIPQIGGKTISTADATSASANP